MSRRTAVTAGAVRPHPAGRALRPAVIALWDWGEAHLTNAPPGREWIPAHPCGERAHAEARCDAGHVAPASEPRSAQPTGRALWPAGIYSAGLPARSVRAPNQRMPGLTRSG